MLRELVDWCLETKLDRLRQDVAEEMEGFRSLLAVDSTVLNLHELPSRKDSIVRVLIWASILALIVSGVLLRAMRRIRPNRVYPAQRADAVFRDFAELILREIAVRRRDKPLDLFEMMLDEAADPNRSRQRSHDVTDSAESIMQRARKSLRLHQISGLVTRSRSSDTSAPRSSRTRVAAYVSEMTASDARLRYFHPMHPYDDDSIGRTESGAETYHVHPKEPPSISERYLLIELEFILCYPPRYVQ